MKASAAALAFGRLKDHRDRLLVELRDHYHAPRPVLMEDSWTLPDKLAREMRRHLAAQKPELAADGADGSFSVEPLCEGWSKLTVRMWVRPA